VVSFNFVKKVRRFSQLGAIIVLKPVVIIKTVMGESKRRKDALGEKYGQESYILPWLPLTKSQSKDFMKWTTRGSWMGIAVLALIWVTVLFIGPAMKWWEVNN